MEARKELKAQEEVQQKMRREMHRGEVQNITKILHNQLLANAPKPLSNKEKQSPVSRSATPAQTTAQEEQDAWRAMGASSGGKPENYMITSARTKENLAVELGKTLTMITLWFKSFGLKVNET
jgi:hypothetical protein